MINGSHGFDLVDQRLFPLLLKVSLFLIKGFDCIVLLVLMVLDLIDIGEVSFSQLFNGFKLLMKTSLIEFAPEKIPPLLKMSVILWLPELDIFLFFLQFDGITLFDIPVFLIDSRVKQFKTKSKCESNDITLTVVGIFCRIICFYGKSQSVLVKFYSNAMTDDSLREYLCNRLKHRSRRLFLSLLANFHDL